MVICKYFLQGCCRFGQNCRYEHVYSSKYTYQASSTNSNVTNDQLVTQVQADIQAALNGGQWILSCYAPYKEKACFPGLNDLSQEEARLIIYEAKANQTLEQAVIYMNNLFKETRNKYQQLLQPSAEIVKVLESIYKGEHLSSPFEIGTQAFGSQQATAIFRSAIQNAPFQNQCNPQTNSVFSRLGNQTNTFDNAPKSLFGQAAQNTFGPSQSSNIFQTQPQVNTAAKSLFAQASQNVFGQQQQQNIFATNHQAPSAFNLTPQHQNPANPFGLPPQNQSANIFQQNVQGTTGANIFGISRHALEKAPADDENVYSKTEHLSQLDLEAYNSSEFKLGFIPELPPPHILCT